MIATSGTGVSPPRRAVTRCGDRGARWLPRSLEAAGYDVFGPLVSCLTPAHVGGLLVLLRSEVAGVPVTVHERFDAERLARAAPPGASVSLVPAMLARLVRTGADLGRFGAILVGGGGLDPEVRDRTEALGARIVENLRAHRDEWRRGLRRRAVRRHRGPDGDGGRIEVRGPTLMRGYRHDAAATGAAFDVRGWLRTGDAGAIDADGRLHVAGRLDEAIRTGAETVWPAEVERALASHPKVAEVGVAGRPHPEWGQQVVAFVVPRTIDDPPSLDELRDHASETIARHKAPREVVLMHELPRTTGGKLRRHAFPPR